MRKAIEITLTDAERSELERLVASGLTPARLVTRSRIVLCAAKGWPNDRIAKQLKIGRNAAGTWRARYAKGRLAAIERDAPGRGRKPTIDGEKIAEIVRRTREETPPGRTHWSLSSMSKAAGVSESTVRRIWKAHGLKPHLVETFKLSRDPKFDEKLVDVIGLYLNPPEKAVVFSVDEKSQIQALDRTQPGLPLKKGRAGTMTHDYKRNGTTTLFAALNVVTGAVVGKCMPRHTHVEWLKFLRHLDKITPAELDVHVVCDNLATHKHPKVVAWLKKRTRFHVHFTPTSSSWLNMVERFFRDITENAIRRGVFVSVKALEEAIEEYLRIHNSAPKPFIWTKSANDILAKVKRAHAALGDRFRPANSGGVH